MTWQILESALIFYVIKKMRNGERDRECKEKKSNAIKACACRLL